MEKKQYLGDGVYGIVEGDTIKLVAQEYEEKDNCFHVRDNVIYLELDVMESLIEFYNTNIKKPLDNNEEV